MIELEQLLAEQTDKTIAVAVHDLETRKEICIQPDQSFHPASTIKVHVMMEVFHQAEQGLFSLEDHLPVTNSFTSIADGSSFSLSQEDDAEKTLYPRLGQTESIRELTRL
ncbi:MAG: class A beta-lactamase-related serine hydrolase, partial [Chloroflexota bacterium]|nr:class A beta-lactamase-related serine hydrolase [Chloroflexota bacterium]